MLSIKPFGFDGTEEELGAICIGPGVGHRENAGTRVAKLEVLIREFVPINGFSAGTIVISEVSTLNNRIIIRNRFYNLISIFQLYRYLAHEVLDNTMKAGSSITEALFSGAEGTEILGCPGNYIGSKLHDDATCGLASDGYIEVATRKGHSKQNSIQNCEYQENEFVSVKLE